MSDIPLFDTPDFQRAIVGANAEVYFAEVSGSFSVTTANAPPGCVCLMLLFVGFGLPVISLAKVIGAVSGIPYMYESALGNEPTFIPYNSNFDLTVTISGTASGPGTLTVYAITSQMAFLASMFPTEQGTNPPWTQLVGGLYTNGSGAAGPLPIAVDNAGNVLTAPGAPGGSTLVAVCKTDSGAGATLVSAPASCRIHVLFAKCGSSTQLVNIEATTGANPFIVAATEVSAGTDTSAFPGAGLVCDASTGITCNGVVAATNFFEVIYYVE